MCNPISLFVLNILLFQKEKEYEVTLPFHDLPFEEISGTEVKITVQLTEVMSGESVFGFSNTKIINNKIVVKFLSKSPIFFTPGTLLQGKVNNFILKTIIK